MPVLFKVWFFFPSCSTCILSILKEMWDLEVVLCNVLKNHFMKGKKISYSEVQQLFYSIWLQWLFFSKALYFKQSLMWLFNVSWLLIHNIKELYILSDTIVCKLGWELKVYRFLYVRKQSFFFFFLMCWVVWGFFYFLLVFSWPTEFIAMIHYIHYQEKSVFSSTCVLVAANI